MIEFIHLTVVEDSEQSLYILGYGGGMRELLHFDSEKSRLLEWLPQCHIRNCNLVYMIGFSIRRQCGVHYARARLHPITNYHENYQFVYRNLIYTPIKLKRLGFWRLS